MKVKICYTVEVDNEYRQALWYYYRGGENQNVNPIDCPMATRQDIKDFHKNGGHNWDTDMLDEYQRSCEEHKERTNESRKKQIRECQVPK